MKFDQGVIAGAIRNELDRGGQVYFVHNRVESIYSMADLLAAARARGARWSSATARWARTSSSR